VGWRGGGLTTRFWIARFGWVHAEVEKLDSTILGGHLVQWAADLRCDIASVQHGVLRGYVDGRRLRRVVCKTEAEAWEMARALEAAARLGVLDI
jgi:hypothetical protein